MPFYIQYVTM